MNISFAKSFVFSLLFLSCGTTLAAPRIDSIALPKSPHSSVILSGQDFGDFGGSILTWDDFENHPSGAKIKNLNPITGHTWTTIYDYDGNGIVIDKKNAVSGNNAIKIDWSVDPQGIRAFGWAGKGPYQELYISYWRTMQGDFVASTCNHKQFYLYGNKSGFPQGMPLIPAGQDSWGFYNNVSTGPISISNPDPNNMNKKGWRWSNTRDTAQRWEFYVKLNQPYTEKNGVIKAWLNGSKGIDNNAYQLRHVDGEFTDFRLGHMASGFYTSANAWFDDVYLATTQARIEVCNSDKYDECTIKHLQYVEPSNWSNTSINFSLRNMKAFKDSSVYLYVIDKNGQVSNPILVMRPMPPFVH